MKTFQVQVIDGCLVPLLGSELEHLLKDKNGNTIDIQLGSTSLKAHHALMAYATWIWEDYYRDRFTSFEAWRVWVSEAEIGWFDTLTSIDASGQEVTRKRKRTWSPDRLTVEDHKLLRQKLSDFGESVTGIGLEEYCAKKRDYIDMTVR